MCAVEGRLVGPDGTVLPHDGEAVGEIEVRGPWVTGSYYKDDDPAKFHDGWLRTGDVGTIDRLGYVTLTDRAKDVIKSGGEWISSMELENVLMAHPQVAEAAVIGVPDEKWGERPLAAVVLAPGATVTAAELRDFLADAGTALAAARAVVVHRRGAQDQRRQVRQDQDPGRVRQRRLRGGRGPLIPPRIRPPYPSGRTHLLCRRSAGTGTLGRTPLGHWEASPSPVYGAALLMRFGFTPIRGSNPRASAPEQALCRTGKVPGFVSDIEGWADHERPTGR